MSLLGQLYRNFLTVSTNVYLYHYNKVGSIVLVTSRRRVQVKPSLRQHTSRELSSRSLSPFFLRHY